MPGAEATMVYQSWELAQQCGFGRGGRFRGSRPCIWVDYKAGEMDSLLDDAQWDFVAPRISEDRVLYFDPPTRRQAAA